MLLKSMQIHGFRSIPNSLDFHIESELTCLVGSNEHGKTNLLDAVEKLSSRQFAAEDRNSRSNSSDHPALSYMFDLTAMEQKAAVAAIESLKKSAEANLQAEEGKEPPSPKLSEFQAQIKRYTSAISNLKVAKEPTVSLELLTNGSLHIELSGLSWKSPPGGSLDGIIGCVFPDVRYFKPSGELVDTITLQELEARSNLPFEGLLKLAELWEQRGLLFGGALQAQRLLIRGSRRLTRRLRAIWSQGSRHTFKLSETNGHLRVVIEDPGTIDSPSTRSLGFKSFLSFMLTLYAETATFTPKGFILLMDEPGIHLHPQGQKDLLRELRKLAKNNQIIYATHSPFMIDRNSPTGTQLVRKELTGPHKGTRLIHKIYGSNWAVFNASLGISPSDAFFPPEKTLLVEGTSDRIYIDRYMGLCSSLLGADLNYFSQLDADRRKEMMAYATLLMRYDREVVILTDGDDGGDKLLKQYRKAAGSKAAKLHFIDMKKIFGANKPVSIEDLLPIGLWFEALSKYVSDVLKQTTRLDLERLKTIQAERSLGKAAAIYLKELGVIQDENDLSKTTVADIFARMDLPIPNERDPMYALCEQVTKQLALRP